MKLCSKCCNLKEINCFYKAPGLKDGLSIFCKQCITGRVKKIKIPRQKTFVEHISGGISKVREKIRIRDNYTCQMCGKKWEKGKRRFDVHHLDEVMRGKTRMKGIIHYDRNNSDKLITFCHKCHFKWHSERGHFK